MKTIAFFNNKGGVGKTTLVYHLACMYAEQGVRVIAADLDPQANLTSMFLPEERLEELWPDGDHPQSILGAVGPIQRGMGDIADPHVEDVEVGVGLLVGDLGLSRFEAKLSAAWPDCMDKDEAAFRAVSSFYRILLRAAQGTSSSLVLIDVGPNLGAINRSALIAADHVVVPLASDLFSLQGLKNLGPNLREWREEWTERLVKRPKDETLPLPTARMEPIGYVILQHAVRLDRPVKAYEKWMERIPSTYRREMLGETVPEESVNLFKSRAPSVPATQDPNCLALLKNYRSLMPLAQDARKPMFRLKAADGALGGHLAAVQGCYDDFLRLAQAIAQRAKLPMPDAT